LAAAARLFAKQPFERITMAGLARTCGLAKGTLYLYFKTKEELFLAVTLVEVDGWLDELGRTLDAGADAAGLVRAIGKTLAPRRELLQLLAILHSVLERNVGVDALRAFKRAMLAQMQGSGEKIERALGFLPAGEGARLLLRVYAVILGLYQVAEPGPAVNRALVAPDLAALRLDFFHELSEVLSALLSGLRFHAKGGDPK
jgi:AcrR family transcriptional regulator